MGSRENPPFTQLGMAALGLIIIGGIYLAAHIPAHVSLGLPIALLILSAGLVAWNLYSLTLIPNFAWDRFKAVATYAGITYLFVAGMIEYAFLEDHVSGGTLVILTLSLLVFALQVPTLIAFTVARFADSEPAAVPPA
jgi:hypothetical protein